ncbi:MAG TPA: hypothetical protein VGJ66_12975 [Pyrinomonadaceae bacterium]|jgi:hypothetical protein
MKLKRTISLIVLSLIISVAFRDANTQTATGVVPCRVGQQAPAIGFWTWAANAHVKVYIVLADFKAEEIPYLLTALQNWNSVSEQTGSGVKLEYQGKTTQQLSCANCLTVMRGSVFNKAKRHATALTAYSVGHDQIISYAAIVVDPVLTNPKALLDAFSHELGHNFGLLDCFTCKKKSTLMNQFKVINEPNNMAAPTPCDIAQVREAYKELKVRVRPSPTFIDQGEEPVDDDTPIVIPNP